MMRRREMRGGMKKREGGADKREWGGEIFSNDSDKLIASSDTTC